MLIIGVDDSGRGPIIGPMVLAGVLVDDSINEQFKAHGVKDSKQLPPKKRRFLAKFIKANALGYKIVQANPEEIEMKIKTGINLNKIEAIKAAQIINMLNISKENIKVILDCPSPNTLAWGNYLKKYIHKLDNLEFVVEHKADVNYPSVSAASILAKTTRDAEIEKIKKRIGKDFGSGYPSDPITCKFLREHADKHKDKGIFRKTWQTWKDLCKEKSQKKLGQFSGK